MSSSRAQSSEVHDTTADAEKQPTGAVGDSTAKNASQPAQGTPTPRTPSIEGGVRELDDDSAVGGPVILESSDPALQHIQIESRSPIDDTPDIAPRPTRE